MKLPITPQQATIVNRLEHLNSLLLANAHAKASYILQKNRYRYLVHLSSIISSQPMQPVLDFGSGYPFIPFVLRELGIHCIPYEPYLSDDIEKVSSTLGLASIKSLSTIMEVRLSGIILNDILEHIPYLLETCQHIRNLSYQSNAVLSLSTPNVFRMRMWLSMILRRHHLPTSIDTILTSSAADSFHIREYSSSNLRSIARALEFTRDISVRYENANLFSEDFPNVFARTRVAFGHKLITARHSFREHLYLLAKKS